MEQHRFKDRMFIDIKGIEKRPCVVAVSGYGRELASKLVYWPRTGCRLVIRTGQQPKGIRGEDEKVTVDPGTTLGLSTPYASEGRRYSFPPVTFRPGFKVTVTGKQIEE